MGGRVVCVKHEAVAGGALSLHRGLHDDGGYILRQVQPLPVCAHDGRVVFTEKHGAKQPAPVWNRAVWKRILGSTE